MTKSRRFSDVWVFEDFAGKSGSTRSKVNDGMRDGVLLVHAFFIVSSVYQTMAVCRVCGQQRIQFNKYLIESFSNAPDLSALASTCILIV